jgi:WD40 repeat protein
MRFSLRQLLVGIAFVSVLLFLFLFLSTADHVGRSNRVHNNVRYLTYSPDGATLAIVHFRARDAGVPFKLYVAEVSDSVELIDAATLSNVTTVDHQFHKGNQGPSHSTYGKIDFSPDGKFLQVGKFWRGPIRTWDIHSERWSESEATGNNDVVDFGCSTDGRWIVKWRDKDGTSVWDSQFQKQLKLNTTRGRLFKFSPDSKRMVFAARDGIQVWDLVGERQIRRFHENRDELDRVSRIEISPDNDTLAMKCREGLCLYSIATGVTQVILPEEVAITRTNTGWATSRAGHTTSGIAFSPDGKVLAAWGSYGLKFFDMAQGCKLQRAPPDQILCFEYSPDGKTYATGDWNGKVAIYDVATGKEIRAAILGAPTRKVSGVLDAVF